MAVQNQAVPVPMTFPQKLAYSAELAKSGLLPSQFRQNPASVLWAVEYAEALGLKGVVAIASIHVIEGKPAPSAAMAAGLIRSKGHVLRVYVTPPTDEHKWGTAVAELTRKDDPDFTFRAEWSVEDAIRAEICKLGEGKDAGKLLQFTQKNGWVVGNWQKFPRQMMKARVLGEVCRDGATDVLLGLHYLAEELEEVELDSNGSAISTGTIPPVSVSTVEADARPAGDHTPAVSGDVSTPGPLAPISRAVQADMMILFRSAGIGGKTAGDRAKRLRVCEILTDRTLTTSADLTDEDGRVVVEALRVAGEDVTTYVADLLAADQAERAEDLQNETTGGNSGEDDIPR